MFIVWHFLSVVLSAINIKIMILELSMSSSQYVILLHELKLLDMYKEFVKGRRTAVHGSNQVWPGFWCDRWTNEWILREWLVCDFANPVVDICQWLGSVHVGRGPNICTFHNRMTAHGHWQYNLSMLLGQCKWSRVKTLRARFALFKCILLCSKTFSRM